MKESTYSLELLDFVFVFLGDFLHLLLHGSEGTSIARVHLLFRLLLLCQSGVEGGLKACKGPNEERWDRLGDILLSLNHTNEFVEF